MKSGRNLLIEILCNKNGTSSKDTNVVSLEEVPFY